MMVNGKRYEASFIQLPAPRDSILKDLEPIDDNLRLTITDEDGNNVNMRAYLALIAKYSNNSVWFKISEQYGKYYITLFYDNGNNRAYGEDL